MMLSPICYQFRSGQVSVFDDDSAASSSPLTQYERIEGIIRCKVGGCRPDRNETWTIRRSFNLDAGSCYLSAAHRSSHRRSCGLFTWPRNPLLLPCCASKAGARREAAANRHQSGSHRAKHFQIVNWSTLFSVFRLCGCFCATLQ